MNRQLVERGCQPVGKQSSGIFYEKPPEVLNRDC